MSCSLCTWSDDSPNSDHHRPPLVSVFMTTREDIFLLLHTFINRTAISLLNVILFIQTQQFIIHMIYDLWKLSHSFMHVRTADKVKRKCRCIGWFYSKPACVFIMHNTSKTTWSVKAICCLCRTGKMISWFINCRGRGTCILMADFGCPCILTNATWIISECFVTVLVVYLSWFGYGCLKF